MNPTDALHIAVVTNDVGQAISALWAGADVNGNNNVGQTPLCLTVNPELVALLLAHGADPKLAAGNGLRPLDVAVTSEASTAAIELLIKAGADPNAIGLTGFTPFTYACKQGEAEDVRVMVQLGADVRAVDARGLSSLLAARRRPDIQAILRAAGAGE